MDAAPQKSTETARAHARALVDVGRPQEALATIRAALASAPDDWSLRADEAWCLLRLGDHAAAVRAAESATAAAPEQEWPHRLRAIALEELGRYKEAVSAAETAVSLGPWVGDAHATLARAAAAAGDRPRADAAAARAAELLAGTSDAHEVLGDVALADKRYTDAERHYRAALRMEPNSALLHNNLGVALQRQRREEEAARSFDTAARLDPAFDVARSNLVSAARRLAAPGGVGAIIGLQWLFRSAANVNGAAKVMLGAVAVLALVAWWRTGQNRVKANLSDGALGYVAVEGRGSPVVRPVLLVCGLIVFSFAGVVLLLSAREASEAVAALVVMALAGVCGWRLKALTGGTGRRR